LLVMVLSLTGLPPPNTIEKLAGSASPPVITGSQDFPARRHRRQDRLQLTVETTMVVEDAGE
jgi:hypothetical protein